MVVGVCRLKRLTSCAFCGGSFAAAFWGAVLGATIPWVISGTWAPGRVIPTAIAGGCVVCGVGRPRPQLSWWLGPALLPAMQIVVFGWVDFRSLVPGMALVAMACAIGLICGIPEKVTKLAAVLVYTMVGVGIVFAQIPWSAGLALLSAPVLVRVSGQDAEMTWWKAREAYHTFALLLWVGILVHGLAR